MAAWVRPGRRKPFVATLGLVAAVALAGCADAGATRAVPAGTPIGPPAEGPASAVARDAVFAELGQRNLIVAATAAPYRPPEAAPLAAAPRNVYQVTLPADPDEGFIVIYELPSDVEASSAAEAQREYLASGPGRVQSPPGTDHVIRRLGSAVIVYDWLPADAQDDAAPRVAEGLRTIGTGYEVAP